MIILRMYYERAIAYIKLHKAYKKERLEKPLLGVSIDFQLFTALLFVYKEIYFIKNYSPSVLSAAFMLSSKAIALYAFCIRVSAPENPYLMYISFVPVDS